MMPFNLIELGYIVVVGEAGLHEACYRARAKAPISFVRLGVRQLVRRLDRHPPLAVFVSERVAARHSDEILHQCWIRRVPVYVASSHDDEDAMTHEVEALLDNVDLPEMTHQAAPSPRESQLRQLEAGW